MQQLQLFYITEQEAKEFLRLQQGSDFSALNYLKNVINDKCIGRTTVVAQPGDGAIRIVHAALELNAYIEMMEIEEEPYNRYLDIAYRDIMGELVECAQKIADITIDGGDDDE